jgi:hypothetical protein
MYRIFIEKLSQQSYRLYRGNSETRNSSAKSRAVVSQKTHDSDMQGLRETHMYVPTAGEWIR